MQIIRLLGSSRIDRPDRKSNHAMPRTRIALLALIALSPARSVRRERLTSLLWPESDPDRALTQLRDILYRTRIVLGDRALFASGHQVCLDPAHVACDVWEFESAVARADWEGAVHRYAGPLLNDRHPGDSAELRRFIARERIRLADLYAHAIESLVVPETVLAQFNGRRRTESAFPQRGYTASTERGVMPGIPSVNRTLQ
jgi:DNA-binding SARP family transcriptional activator